MGANLIPAGRVERRLLPLRGQKVMLDFPLAELYRVPTKALNRAVKRNLERLPETGGGSSVRSRARQS